MDTVNIEEVALVDARGEGVRVNQEELDRFGAQIRGDVLYAGCDGYEQARLVWNGMIDRRPGLIVRCSGVADVIHAVRFARAQGIRLTVRGGGHNVSGSALAEGGLVIDLSSMRGVQVDPSVGTARAQGGALLGDLDHETQAFGLAVPVGVVSQTGVGGLTLHGGMGWLLRRHGLTVDNLLSAELVTAEGELLRASPRENPELFWALKGGGGNFGVVTSFEYRAHPVGPDVWVSIPMYPLDRADKVLGFWRDYMSEAPEELSSIAVLWSAPEDPDIPEKHHGEPTVILLALHSGPYEKGEKILRPLREIGDTIADLSGPMKFELAQKILDADYPDGRQYYWKARYLRELNDGAIADIAEFAARRPSPLTSLDIWALGGAFARVDVKDTPFAFRNAPFMFTVESNWEDPTANDENLSWSRDLYDHVGRYSDGGVYLNFPGMAEEGARQMEEAYGRNHRRLLRVKQSYDPENMFRDNLVS